MGGFREVLAGLLVGVGLKIPAWVDLTVGYCSAIIPTPKLIRLHYIMPRKTFDRLT